LSQRKGTTETAAFLPCTNTSNNFHKKQRFAKGLRGERRDAYLYSILREEWKEPRILTRTEKK